MAFLIPLLAGFLFVAFGRWGLNTAKGQEMFPEMAGIIPTVFLGAGYVLIVASLVVLFVFF